jgi:hypothetical protein
MLELCAVLPMFQRRLRLEGDDSRFSVYGREFSANVFQVVSAYRDTSKCPTT